MTTWEIRYAERNLDQFIVRLQGVQLLPEEQVNPYAPPENSPRIGSLDPDISLRRRLRKIFYIHLASVVVLSIVMRIEGNFLTGGQIAEFLVLFPLGSTFYVCPAQQRSLAGEVESGYCPRIARMGANLNRGRDRNATSVQFSRSFAPFAGTPAFESEWTRSVKFKIRAVQRFCE